MSPSYLDQYLGAARKLAQQAMGNAKSLPVVTTYGNKNDMVIALAAEGLPASGSQLIYKEGMPFGTRGGISFVHDFPATGEYALTIGDLASGRQIPRMEFSSTVIALLDGRERLSALGVTNLEVSMKNISSRKITSIMAARLNSGSTLWRRLSPIIF